MPSGSVGRLTMGDDLGCGSDLDSLGVPAGAMEVDG